MARKPVGHVAGNRQPFSPCRIESGLGLGAPLRPARRTALSALRIARTIFAQPAMAHRTTSEHLPGAQLQSDEELRGYVRQYGASMHHWAGSCRMGTDAECSDPHAQAITPDHCTLRLVQIDIEAICRARLVL